MTRQKVLIKRFEPASYVTTPVIIKEQPKWTTDDWRTPDEEEQPVVTLVRQALGGAIGLDPTADNGRGIPAQRHITKTDDCLQLDWESPAGTVLLNPPYSNPLPFLEKLIEQIDQGHVREAIVLLPLRCIGNQGTGNIIEERAKAQCVWKRNGRLAFLAEDGTPRKKTDFVSCLIYFGDMEHRFAETFREYGVVSYFEKKPIFIPLKTEYYQAFKNGSKRIEYRKAGTGQFTLAGCFPGRRVTLSRGYSAHDRIKGTIVKSWVDHHESPSGAIAACYGTEPIDIIAIEIAVNSKTQCGKNAVVTGTEKVRSPLQKSELHKKGLCDYVINVASGCLHGCTFCYVPSTPVIRFRQKHLQDKGVENPQQDWGKYLFTRDAIAQQLEEVLASKRTWEETPAGKGVVMLCSGTDPYQNQRTAAITRACVEVLLKYDKRVRILTRSPLWTQDLDVLVNPLVTVGMSLPHLDDRLSRQIEPNAPLPSDRYRALQKGAAAGCRLFIAMAPTPPQMVVTDFLRHLSELKKLNPEVIFWEPINARGTNGARMLNAGLDFVKDISKTQAWADNFVRQWRELNVAASLASCQKLLHIWPDRALKGYIPDNELESWWSQPTREQWPPLPNQPSPPVTDMFTTSEECYNLADDIADIEREAMPTIIQPQTPIADSQAPEPLTVALIDEKIAAFTEEIEALEEQVRARREEIAKLKELTAIYLGQEFEEKLEELKELFARSSQHDGLTDHFCAEFRRFQENVCPGTCPPPVKTSDEAIDTPKSVTCKTSVGNDDAEVSDTKSPSSLEQQDGEKWYFENSGKKKSLFCTNFNFREENPQLPEVLKMRLANRGKKPLEKICTWAIAEGLAESYIIHDFHDPLKKLSPTDTRKPEANIILTNPSALKIIVNMLASKNPPPPSRKWAGEIGQLFYPGDRVRRREFHNKQWIERDYIVSKIETRPGVNGSPPATGYHLTSVEPGEEDRHNASLPWVKYHNCPTQIELIAVAPDFDCASNINAQEQAPGIPEPKEAADRARQAEDWARESEEPQKTLAISQTTPEEIQKSNLTKIFDFPNTKTAKDWENWFARVIDRGKVLSTDVKVSRSPWSKELHIRNLTDSEMATLNNLTLPQEVPPPSQAKDLWEAAAATTTPQENNNEYVY